jgi:hypothetical protein
MAIATGHPPNASVLRRVMGPDRKITRDTTPLTHRPMARWTAQPGTTGPPDQARGVANYQ